MNNSKTIVSFTKNNFFYFVLFIISNLLIFLFLLYTFLQFDQNFRDKYTTNINIELNKTQEFYQTNDMIFNIYKDFFIADLYFQKKILGLEDADFSFDIEKDYEVFFENLSSSIYLKILRSFSSEGSITNLQINTTNPFNPDRIVNNFINISFNSVEDISNQILIKIDELINYNLDRNF